MDEFKVTYFEVYVLEPEGWELHARFPGEDRQLAFVEAKNVEARLSTAAKVVRSIYYPRHGREERADVYTSRMTSTEAIRHAGPGRSPAARGHRRPEDQARVFTPGGLIWRLLRIVLSSAIAAGAATALFSFAIGDSLHFDGLIDRDGQKMVIYAVFTFLFLTVAVPRVVGFARSVDEIVVGAAAGRPSRTVRHSPGRPAKARRPAPMAGPADTPPAEHRPPAGEAAQPQADPPAAQPQLDPAEQPQADPPAAEPSPVPPVAVPPPASAAAPSPAPAEQPASSDPDPAADEAGKPTEAGGRTLRIEPQRVAMMRLLGGFIAALAPRRARLDAYDRFGIGLALAGAAEETARDGTLSEEDGKRLLREAMETMGAPAALTEAFCDGYREQLEEPRSLRMVAAGREAMRRFLAGEQDPFRPLLEAFEAWSRPSPTVETGLVAALAVSGGWGDGPPAGVAEVVATHQGVVVADRPEDFGALFATVRGAVQAAVALAALLPPGTRLGLHAGEAVEAGDAQDILALARLVRDATASGVACSAAVRALAAGLPVGFEMLAGTDAAGQPVHVLVIGTAGLSTTAPSPASAEAGPAAPERPEG